ncbi:hypothetical protein [Gracilibacillus dipsosauri]|uniref:Uncharacterized protein n=1 Tax=Gracilibacillus dipsosauri TaxID=178340 RepID=A0A317KZ29_9BACI|nr:hypothetical protein [Gracilibacillus dipsosauri]PWU68792.1 hypothetical protein DLJ74_10245 [Gracilibacillus dipsosauri]
MNSEDIRDILLNSSEKDIVTNFQTIFGLKNGSSNSIIHLNEIRKLSLSTITLGIARMEKIEQELDYSKYMPFLIALLAIYIGIFNSIEFEINLLMPLINLIGFGIFFLLFIKSIKKGVDRRASAIYLKSILQQVKEEKVRGMKIK